jgi:hypothetical protein
MAAIHGRSPPPYTFVNGDLNFLQNIWLKSVVYGLDPFKDALKRPITTIPPSITITHHDGSLPSQLSYTLADDNPPLPSMPTQTFATKCKGKAPILKQWVDKMGSSAACGQIRSKTSNGEDHSTPNHNHTS